MKYNKESLKVVGHPVLDEYLNSNKNSFAPKYTIYAPHWTVCGDNLRFGTFDWSGGKILEFAKSHPELNWVFRPHPLLYKFAISSGFMSKEEIDNYYNEWKKIGIFSESGDYIDLFKSSEAMITDCGSFLTEYFVSEKPMIHLISNELKENATIKEIDKTNYTARNLEELEQQLKDVLIDKNDYKKSLRIELLEKLKLKNNYSAKRIIDDVLTSVGQN
jgi:CDP-glycerol glycerophosphotransferase (TagB/SpsB family)